MSDCVEERCRICLKSRHDCNIEDSTCYAKFFIQVTGSKDFTGKLWLCIWCKATLKRTIKLVKQAVMAESTLNNVSVPLTKDVFNLCYIQNAPIDIPPESTVHEVKHINDIRRNNIDVTLKESYTGGIYQEYNATTIYQDPTALKISQDFIASKVYQDSNASKLFQDSNALKEFQESNALKVYQETNESNINQEHNDSKIFEQSNDSTIRELNDDLKIQELIATHQESMPTKITNRKIMNCEQLKFEMKHLNLQEQLNEVELKKMKNRNMKFTCDYCGTGFLTVDLFDQHKLRHSEVAGSYACTVCGLRFKSSNVLSHHVLSHKRRFRCLICAAAFNRWSHCLTHRYKCGSVSAPTSCVYCLKIFSDVYSLNVHIKGVHKTVKKYICEHCQVGFGSKHRLTVHMRTHTGVKPFSCAHCPRTFTTNSNLRAHSSVHEVVIKHYCVECNTHYKTAKSLKRHFEQSARHIVLKDHTFLCKVCSKYFSSEKSLNNHIKVRHNTVYRCKLCDKTFSSNTNLNKHIRCIHTAG